MAEDFYDFFEHFGTHYATQMTLGSAYQMTKFFNKDVWENAERVERRPGLAFGPRPTGGSPSWAARGMHLRSFCV